MKQLICDERFINIHKAQAGLTRLLSDASKKSIFYRVLKNDQPLGVLIPENLWAHFAEDIEALSSSNYKRRIKNARSDIKRIKSTEVKKQLGL